MAVQKRGYQWLHTYSFVHPGSGASEFWIMSHVDIPTMLVVLHQFVLAVNPDETKIILLLWDNAGWHTSPQLDLPPGLILYPIPPYTPELSPAEPLMPLLHETLANRPFTHLKQIEDRLVERCLYLQANPLMVKGACGFHWACF